MRKASNRESAQRRRDKQGCKRKPRRQPLPGLDELRLRNTAQCLAVLEEQIEIVNAIEDDDPKMILRKAREITNLVTVAMRCLQAGRCDIPNLPPREYDEHGWPKDTPLTKHEEARRDAPYFTWLLEHEEETRDPNFIRGTNGKWGDKRDPYWPENPFREEAREAYRKKGRVLSDEMDDE